MNHKSAFLLTLSLCLFGALTVGAQDPDHVLSITSASGGTGSSVNIANLFTNTSAVDIAGWSWGNCSDDAAAAGGNPG